MKTLLKVCGLILIVGLLLAVALDWLGFHQLFGSQVEFNLATAKIKQTRYFLFRPVEVTIQENPVSKTVEKLGIQSPEQWRIAIRRPLTSKKAEGLSEARYLIANKTLSRLLESESLTNDERITLVTEYLAILQRGSPEAADNFSEQMWENYAPRVEPKKAP